MIDFGTASLLTAMMDAFGRPAGEIAAAFSGRRDELVRLLTRLFRDPEFHGDYLDAVMAEVAVRGGEFQTRLWSCPGYDIPADTIVATGFVTLSVEVLVDLAISAEALGAIEELLHGDDAEARPMYSALI
eukprot:Opistho-2@47733